jgi:hypothetical protein
MASLVDLFLVYQFIIRLITPFNQWDAYKLGIIDEKGKVLKKRSSLSTPQERKAWGYFDILAGNLKKLLAKFPGGESKLVSYAAAGLLLREQKNLEKMSDEELEALAESIVKKVAEEGPANVAGSGEIAGLGVGAQGEPGGKSRLFKKPLKRRRDQ